MPGSERMSSVSSCLCPPARSRMSWLCSNVPEVSQQELHVGVRPHAGQVRPERHVQLRDLLHHQPVQLLRASGRPSAPPGPGSARSSASWTPGASCSLATIVRARCVFPVPGRPVSSRELPARQWHGVVPVVWGAPPPCAAPGCCPATASSLPRGRPACRPGGAAPPAPAAAP